MNKEGSFERVYFPENGIKLSEACLRKVGNCLLLRSSPSETSVRAKKGQSAIEFLVLVGGVVFFTIMFLSLVQLNISDDVREQRNIMVREVAFIVQDEIVLAHNSIDGYSRNFTLPRTVAGARYEMNISQGWLTVETLDKKHAAGFPVLNVTVGGDGVNAGGVNTIKKDDGIVYINE